MSCTKRLGNAVERDVFFDATDLKEDVGGGVKPSLLEVLKDFFCKVWCSHKCQESYCIV